MIREPGFSHDLDPRDLPTPDPIWLALHELAARQQEAASLMLALTMTVQALARGGILAGPHGEDAPHVFH